MVYETNELTHWGIKGMRWGVRRFQNKDGSLTAAGKKRRIKESNAAVKKKAKQAKESDPKKKSIKDMSDDELNKAIRRAQMEDQYRALRPEKVSTGKKITSALAKDVIAPAAMNAGKRFLENALNKFGDKMLKDVVDPDSVAELTKTRDKLKLKDEIDKLKNPDKYTSWDDKLKEQTYNKNKRAEEKERKAEEEAAKRSTEDSTSTAERKAQRFVKKKKVDTSEDAGDTSSSTKKSTTIDLGDADWKDVTDSGKSYSSSLTSSSAPVASLPPAQTSAGKSLVDDILDKYY